MTWCWIPKASIYTDSANSKVIMIHRSHRQFAAHISCLLDDINHDSSEGLPWQLATALQVPKILNGIWTSLHLPKTTVDEAMICRNLIDS